MTKYYKIPKTAIAYNDLDHIYIEKDVLTARDFYVVSNPTKVEFNCPECKDLLEKEDDTEMYYCPNCKIHFMIKEEVKQ